MKPRLCANGFGNTPRMLPADRLPPVTASGRMTVSYPATGRPGFDNHVEIDDQLLASLHAVFTQAADGTWRLSVRGAAVCDCEGVGQA